MPGKKNREVDDIGRTFEAFAAYCVETGSSAKSSYTSGAMTSMGQWPSSSSRAACSGPPTAG
ncbi:MAG: hypothetical protein ACRDM7_08250, partial [Thermoleophilaceae bacterium]